MRRAAQGFSLVGLLVVMVIIAILVVVFMVGPKSLTGSTAPSRPDGKGTTTVGGAIYKAKDEVCRGNLQQLRTSIKVTADSNDETPPASLQETHLGSDFYSCPIGHEPYSYDPKTGEVHCPHPGHESY